MSSFSAATSEEEEVNQEIDEQVQQQHQGEGSDEEDNSVEQEDKEFNEWVEDEEEAIRVKSLFSDTQLGSIESLIEHDKQKFQFDLKQVVEDVCTDDLSFIRLINFIRSSVNEISEVSAAQVSEITETIYSKVFLNEDRFMRPAQENDPLLYLYEDIFDFGDGDD
jgi:protein arginine N-methyltransferase 3